MTQKKSKILFITDNGESSLSFHEDFAASFEVIVSDRPDRALDTVVGVQPEVLVLSFRDRATSPLALAQALRSSQHQIVNYYLGLIYVSPREVTQWFERALAEGIDICLPEDRTTTQLHAAITSVLRICETRHELQDANQRLARAQERLKKLSLTDELTGLYNIRFLSRQLRTEFKRAQRYQKHLSLLFINMDQFARINEDFGTQMGSDILTQVGQVIGDSVRFEIDYTARWGADEFAILLPETDLVGAISVAERLRRAIADRYFDNGHNQAQLTASVGVVHFNGERGNFTTADELIRTAHRAVQHAKENGGNQYWAMDECPELPQTLDEKTA